MKKIGKFILFIIMIISVVVFIRTKANSNVIATTIPEKQETKKEEPAYTEKSCFPTEVYGVPVYTDLIESGTEARPGTKRKIKYIVIHETDNFENGVGAKNHAKFLKLNNTEATSWHYTVDDKEIYHHIPDNEIAYHAANEAGNQYGIGIELCVNKDGNFEKTFRNATKLVSYLLKEYGLTINDVRTHNDFSGKDCPYSILKAGRMDEFKSKCGLIK